MIDVRRLRYFVAVAEEQHFSRAAERLGISQPPLSEHISALERELGVALFQRTTRSVSLTEDGLNLLPHARRILRDIDRCGEVIRDARWERMSTLRIGILHAHAYTFLPRLLAAWARHRPDVRLTLREHATQDQTTVLLAGDVDLAFVREPVHENDLGVTRLFSEPYCIALPERWTTAKAGRISVSELQDCRMIGFPSHHASGSTRTLFRDFLIKHKVKTADFLEVRTMHAALALVAGEQGFSPVPRSQSKLGLHGVRYLPLVEPPPQLSVGLAHRSQGAGALAQEFIDFCVEHFQRPDW
ncbi:LysR family transcriptional regulator [Cupriavidus respiraculi]|uniref:HTH-type transcriptional regulator BenM n=1 Tax=Cupriavidus respiraculi TaxID=195930 RepID=A0ABM8WF24_9BURK|nr:LysR family transcriptional regulator [Cupriavidus respiraculi]CAG9165863.1 HTH-type transcriptional regulator BenM [Cupriavidus respiraculi]